MVDRAIALAVLTSAVALACGGRVATQATDGRGASDAETTTDGALCPPHLNACVMCTDGFYKCGEDATPEVPACPLYVPMNSGSDQAARVFLTPSTVAGAIAMPSTRCPIRTRAQSILGREGRTSYEVDLTL
jgi:hypothetical protein